MIWASPRAAAIVDSLVQHVLYPCKGPFGADGTRTKNIHNIT
ncbi:hypothetical protein FOXYSP1_13054 [Fusarium oxysporum f. sp. phaseoli]